MKLVNCDKRFGSGGNCRITLAIAGLVESEQVPILLLQVTSEDPLPRGTRRSFLKASIPFVRGTKGAFDLAILSKGDSSIEEEPDYDYE